MARKPSRKMVRAVKIAPDIKPVKAKGVRPPRIAKPRQLKVQTDFGSVPPETLR